MKKLLFLFTLLTITFIGAYAQNSDHTPTSGDSWRPSEGEIGMTMQVNGLAFFGVNAVADPLTGNGMLWIHYMLADDLAARVGLGINSRKTHTVTENTNPQLGLETGTFMWDSTGKRGSFILSLGVEKHMGGMAKLDPYLGAQIGMAMIGKTKGSSTTDVTGADTSDTDVATSNSTWETTTPGGFGFAISVLGGFRYFFADHIAIGAEINWGFASVAFGGESTATFHNESTFNGTANTDIDNTSTSSSKTTVSGMGVRSVNGAFNNTAGATVGLSLTWFFGN